MLLNVPCSMPNSHIDGFDGVPAASSSQSQPENFSSAYSENFDLLIN